MSKNSQHDCVKRGGGSRAVYTMCKKTSDLAEDGFPYTAFYNALQRIKWKQLQLEFFIIPKLVCLKLEKFLYMESIFSFEKVAEGNLGQVLR